MCGRTDTYRLVFRSKDRETGSGYATPTFRCQLPENLYKDGTNKKIKVYLEYAGIGTDGTDPHDAIVIKMRNFAINGSQTNGAGRFEGISTLGIADLIHGHGNNEVFVSTRVPFSMSWLEYNAFQFNQGKIDFILERLDGGLLVAPAADQNHYVIMLSIHVDKDD